MMWWQEDILFAGKCSAHGGYGKKAHAVYFGGGQDNLGDKLYMERSSGKWGRGQDFLCHIEKGRMHILPGKRQGS